MSRLDSHPALRLLTSSTPKPPLGRRVRDMLLLWTLLGAVVGLAIAPPGGLIGPVSFGLAGLIVLSPLGAVLGAVGGQIRLTLAGALCGATIGALVGLLASAAGPGHVASVGLVGGGMAGATSSVLLGWAHALASHALLAGRNA